MVELGVKIVISTKLYLIECRQTWLKKIYKEELYGSKYLSELWHNVCLRC